MGEIIQNQEILRQIRGIMIVTKSMRHSCPLANLVASSGIEKAIPQLSLIINTDRPDYNEVVAGGDTKGMWKAFQNAYDFMSIQRPFIVFQNEDITTIGLWTYVKDHGGRTTPVSIGLKGISKPDTILGFQLMRDILPRLTFTALQREPSSDEVENFVSNKIVVHPPIIPIK